MKPDLDFELPACEDTSFPPPRLDNASYLEFIEFNLRVVRDSGTAERVMNSRTQPVDATFVMG